VSCAKSPFGLVAAISTNRFRADEQVVFEVVVTNRSDKAFTIQEPMIGGGQLQLWYRQNPDTNFKPMYPYAERIREPRAIEIPSHGSFKTHAEAKYDRGEYEVYFTFTPVGVGPPLQQLTEAKSNLLMISIQ
jgi:hypothetical protein